MPLNIKPKEAAQLDLLALGETMIRLSPPAHGRLEFIDTLEVSRSAAANPNVAYALARLGLHFGWTNRLVDNPLGQLVLNHARAVGVDVSAVAVAPYDGVGNADRIGLNFTEVGTRRSSASVTMYDPRPFRRHAHEAHRYRLRQSLFQTRRPLAPHRRHRLHPPSPIPPPPPSKPSSSPKPAAPSPPTTSTSAPRFGPPKKPRMSPANWFLILGAA